MWVRLRLDHSEAVERSVDFLCIESMEFRVSSVFQIGHNGAGFLFGENGKPATRMIVPGHGPYRRELTNAELPIVFS